MQVPDGTWYYGWAGSPPYPVSLNPGDEIPDGVMATLDPASGLLAACVAADPVATSAALGMAQAPAAVQAVASTAVAAFIAAQPVRPVAPVLQAPPASVTDAPRGER